MRQMRRKDAAGSAKKVIWSRLRRERESGNGLQPLAVVMEPARHQARKSLPAMGA